MITFPHVEDYIEVIAGIRDAATKQLTNNFFGFAVSGAGGTPIINLARYDVAVIQSMGEQAAQGKAFTARQAALIIKIILKYKRQLASKLIDVTPVENPVWRVPLRDMDYSKTLDIKENKISVVFPYEQRMVDSIKAFAKDAQGTAKWDHETRKWEIGLTEYNLSGLHTWCKLNEFTITESAQTLMNLIVAVEATDYKIELSIVNDVPVISNAPESLIQYITEHEGGLTIDNINKLVDMSAILGYTIDPDIASALVSEYGQKFYTLMSSKEVKMNPAIFLQSDDFEAVLRYAEIVNRYPVVIYEPDLSGRMLNKLKTHYTGYIQENGQNKNPTVDPGAKFIHTYTPLRLLERIPLMISSAGMVFGGDKQIMFNRAEKVVYCSNEVYNKGTNLKVKDINGESNITDKR